MIDIIESLAGALMNALTATLDECARLLEGLREHAYLAKQTALRLQPAFPRFVGEDLEQAALAGVWLGLTTWDGRGTLKGWVIQRARWAVFEYVDSCIPVGVRYEGQRYWRAKGKPLHLRRTCSLSALARLDGQHEDLAGSADSALADYSQAQAWQRAELREECDKLLRLLPKGWADLLRRHHLDGQSKSDIARDLGCSAWAVSLRLNKAWRRLKYKARCRAEGIRTRREHGLSELNKGDVG